MITVGETYAPHKLEGDTQVVSEVEVVQHVDDVVGALLVSAPQVIQNLHLHQSLLVEPLLVSGGRRKVLLTFHDKACIQCR